MLVDCDGCAMRDVACMECSVGVLLGLPAARATDAGPDRPAADSDADADAGVGATARAAAEGRRQDAVDADLVVEHWPGRRPFDWDATERRAIRALIDGGLIPPIRPVDDAHSVTRGADVVAERGRLAG